MKQIYLKHGSTFVPADSEAMNIQDTLPLGTYTIVVTPVGLQLEKVDDFVLPAKLYGNVEKQSDRILNTFMDRPAGTGVMLSGNKGAGKTMLTKRLSQKAMEKHGVITILINQALCGEAFNAFIQAIEQPAIILFDEFEKVYDREQQASLLTIFDGTYSSKKLFLLTCNDPYKVDTYMHNRPGRIYYALEFGSLERDFIADYCADNLKNLANTNGVVAASVFFNEFSFDMLKALIEEMNRYDENATDAMKVLNMKPESDSSGVFDVVVLRDGKRVTGHDYSGEVFTGNPLSRNGWNVIVHAADPEDGEKHKAGDVTVTENYKLDLSKIISVDSLTGSFVFGTQRADTTLNCTRRVTYVHSLNYDALV
jgi:hypothetical protein